MEFSVKKNDIIDVLGKVQGITNRRSNLAITETVLIRSTDTGISIAATDLETGFEGYYPAIVEEEGEIAINAKKLYEIVKNFPSDTILIQEQDNRWFKIGNVKVEYNIGGMNPDDFPVIPVINDIEFFDLNSFELRKMIERTIMIGHTGDEKRAHLIGVYFECIEAENKLILRMVATDGKRLSKMDYDYLDQPVGMSPGSHVIIPKKGLSDIAKFLDYETVVRVGIKDNHFIMKNENESFIINLLEGDFPDFTKALVVPENGFVEFDKNALKMMLKRMSILTSEDYKGVIFKLEDGLFEIITTNPEIGESKEDMEIGYTGEKIEAVLNPYFFVDAIQFIESSKIFMHIRDGESPVIVHGENDTLFLTVIMPMRI